MEVVAARGATITFLYFSVTLTDASVTGDEYGPITPSTLSSVMSAPRAFVVIREPPRREMEPTTDSIHAFDVSRQRSVHSLRHDRRRPRRPPCPRPLEPALGSVLRDAARGPGRRCDQGGAPRWRRPRAPGRPAPRRRVGAVHDGESQQALDD